VIELKSDQVWLRQQEIVTDSYIQLDGVVLCTIIPRLIEGTCGDASVAMGALNKAVAILLRRGRCDGAIASATDRFSSAIDRHWISWSSCAL
jgi:hypothetical protein